MAFPLYLLQEATADYIASKIAHKDPSSPAFGIIEKCRQDYWSQRKSVRYPLGPTSDGFKLWNELRLACKAHGVEVWGFERIAITEMQGSWRARPAEGSVDRTFARNYVQHLAETRPQSRLDLHDQACEQILIQLTASEPKVLTMQEKLARFRQEFPSPVPARDLLMSVYKMTDQAAVKKRTAEIVSRYGELAQSKFDISAEEWSDALLPNQELHDWTYWMNRIADVWSMGYQSAVSDFVADAIPAVVHKTLVEISPYLADRPKEVVVRNLFAGPDPE